MKFEGFKVHGETACDENNNTVYKPLSFWMEYFGIHREGDTWYTKDGMCMFIEKANGYGLIPDEYESEKNKSYFVGNADLDRPKLRAKWWERG